MLPLHSAGTQRAPLSRGGSDRFGRPDGGVSVALEGVARPKANHGHRVRFRQLRQEPRSAVCLCPVYRTPSTSRALAMEAYLIRMLSPPGNISRDQRSRPTRVSIRSSTQRYRPYPSQRTPTVPPSRSSGSPVAHQRMVYSVWSYPSVWLENRTKVGA